PSGHRLLTRLKHFLAGTGPDRLVSLYPCGLRFLEQTGKSLWMLWIVLESGEDAHRAELLPSRSPQCRARLMLDLPERLVEALREQPRRLVVVGLRAAGRLGHDRFDHAE